MTAPRPVSARQHAALFWMLMLNAVGVSSLLSLLAPAARIAHIPDALIVTAQALSAIAWILVGRFWSRLADRRGHRRVILIGAAGSALATALTGAAIWIGVNHVVAPMTALAALVIGRSAYGGIGLAGNPAAQGFVARRTPPAERTAALARLAAAQGTGTIVGPAVAPFLTALPVAGLAGPLAVAALLMLLTVPLLAVLLPRDRVAAPAGGHAAPALALWRAPALRGYMAYSLLIAFALTASLQTTGFLVLDTIGGSPAAAQAWVGRTIMAGAIVTLIVQFVAIPRLRLSPRTLMIAGPGLAIAGAALLASGPRYPLIVVGVMILDAGFALARPGVSAAASLAVPPGRQAEIAGALLSAFSLGIVVGPVMGVGLYAIWRPLPFAAIALLLSLALILTARDRGGRVSVVADQLEGLESPDPIA